NHLAQEVIEIQRPRLQMNSQWFEVAKTVGASATLGEWWELRQRFEHLAKDFRFGASGALRLSDQRLVGFFIQIQSDRFHSGESIPGPRFGQHDFPPLARDQRGRDSENF